ncbi:MAG: hypothetical protein JWR54_1866 [Mucilaginibacter sp.]|jgi:hypothetical protein|nr:hypothetical protein [Mucilaginibacter sp.]
MTDFKLIAIRPLPDCMSRYTKVLNPGQLYPFYQGYQFYRADGHEALPMDEIAAVSVAGFIPLRKSQKKRTATMIYGLNKYSFELMR